MLPRARLNFKLVPPYIFFNILMSGTSNYSAFEAFDQYDFDKDVQFQSGIASLLNNKQANEAELLEKAKLFYYTKCVQGFDVEAYTSWKSEKQEPVVEQATKEETDKPPRFTFQELVDMIEKGIEIPGIKQIPNVLNEGTPSEAKMTARPKPWERK
ncbi:uncharacterized protein EV154DRAFT_499144 [Mucor mucedo]|uniref:uncharacterized protein n=1 Tax=Mucor mucedo TaxID=29922 RepID=UPI00221EB570|nr:uncharacterized protein EV154DRAFT_499144 [Mucor mucedo]KAI7894291.1 hypothetical protein EV154DRAFT_499144 [Mucor mucedo]